MSPSNLGVLASQISGHLYSNSYESIATVTLASDTATISFTGIPSTYSSLQIRGIGRATFGSTSTEGVYITMNGDGAGNYATHHLTGDGTSAAAGAYSTPNGSYIFANNLLPMNNETANMFGAFVFDIHDYASTSKFKTLRAMYGYNNNTSTDSFVRLLSGLWRSTSAVTSITFTPELGSFKTGTKIALYGVK